jgi:hypothetical protein
MPAIKWPAHRVRRTPPIAATFTRAASDTRFPAGPDRHYARGAEFRRLLETYGRSDAAAQGCRTAVAEQLHTTGKDRLLVHPRQEGRDS